MRRDQADVIYLALFANWSYPKQPAAAGRSFRAKLERLPDVGAASETADLLIDKLEWFPTWATFRREYDATVRRCAAEQARLRGIEEPPPDFAFQAAKARELLDRLRSGADDDA